MLAAGVITAGSTASILRIPDAFVYIVKSVFVTNSYESPQTMQFYVTRPSPSVTVGIALLEAPANGPTSVELWMTAAAADDLHLYVPFGSASYWICGARLPLSA